MGVQDCKSAVSESSVDSDHELLSAAAAVSHFGLHRLLFNIYIYIYIYLGVSSQQWLTCIVFRKNKCPLITNAQI